jgi:hypothetical protein
LPVQTSLPHAAFTSLLSKALLPRTVLPLTKVDAPAVLIEIPHTVCPLPHAPVYAVPLHEVPWGTDQDTAEVVVHLVVPDDIVRALKIATPPCSPSAIPLLLMMLWLQDFVRGIGDIDTNPEVAGDIVTTMTIPLAGPIPIPSPWLAVTTLVST